MKRLLLISNSTNYGGGYLDHCEEEIRDFLGPIDRVLFIPFAIVDWDGYAAKARQRFEAMGIALASIHEAEDPRRALGQAPAVFTGGGNTFRLLKRLYDLDLIEPIRDRVEAGAAYFGASAGSNIACVTIKTTNDMPIVQPPSFDALNLVPFNINPHYIDPDPTSTHRGETREQRIVEFLEENDRLVIGLREGAMLRIEGSEVSLRGTAAARLFRRGQEPQECQPGDRLDVLLVSPPGTPA